MASAVQSRPGQAAPPPAASHTSFILGQIRSGLAHLRNVHALDDASFDRIDGLLTRSVRINEETSSSQRGSEGAVAASDNAKDKDELGQRNAWMRETLSETSLLSDLVDTALQIGVPSGMLGSAQREAIVLLVERSQAKIANAVTDPKRQRRAHSGAVTTAKGSYSGLRKGINIAGQGVQELQAKTKEAKARSKEKKAEKEEQRQMKQELKDERRKFQRQKQQEALARGKGPGSDSAQNEQSLQSLRHSENTDDSDDDSNGYIDDQEAKRRPSNSFDDDEGGAMASVTCDRLREDGASENAVVATTTFSPWPGLLLSSTIIAAADEPNPSRVSRLQNSQSSTSRTQSDERSLPPLPPPQRRDAGAFQSRGESSAPTQDRGAGASVDASAKNSQSVRAQRDYSTPPPQSSLEPEGGQTRAPLTSPTAQSGSSGEAMQSSSGTMSSSARHQSEVTDVTESKQKGWAKKLGL